MMMMVVVGGGEIDHLNIYIGGSHVCLFHFIFHYTIADLYHFMSDSLIDLAIIFNLSDKLTDSFTLLLLFFGL